MQQRCSSGAAARCGLSQAVRAGCATPQRLRAPCAHRTTHTHPHPHISPRPPCARRAGWRPGVAHARRRAGGVAARQLRGAGGGRGAQGAGGGGAGGRAGAAAGAGAAGPAGGCWGCCWLGSGAAAGAAGAAAAATAARVAGRAGEACWPGRPAAAVRCGASGAAGSKPRSACSAGASAGPPGPAQPPAARSPPSATPAPPVPPQGNRVEVRGSAPLAPASKRPACAEDLARALGQQLGDGALVLGSLDLDALELAQGGQRRRWRGCWDGGQGWGPDGAGAADAGGCTGLRRGCGPAAHAHRGALPSSCAPQAWGSGAGPAPDQLPGGLARPRGQGRRMQRTGAHPHSTAWEHVLRPCSTALPAASCQLPAASCTRCACRSLHWPLPAPCARMAVHQCTTQHPARRRRCSRRAEHHHARPPRPATATPPPQASSSPPARSRR